MLYMQNNNVNKKYYKLRTIIHIIKLFFMIKLNLGQLSLMYVVCKLRNFF